jgi:DNA-binding transcriptional ArsR family regulator
LFRLLGDSVRARIVSSLTAAEEMCVGDIAVAIGARENAVSYALRQLRSAGLVQRRPRGREIYYTLADRRPAELLERARRRRDKDRRGAARRLASLAWDAGRGTARRNALEPRTRRG